MSCAMGFDAVCMGWLPDASAGVAGVTSVNGDVGPAVSLVAADIPSTGPSDVQADIDALAPIMSLADLDGQFGPPVGTVYTIDRPSRWEIPTGATEIDITPFSLHGVQGAIYFDGGVGTIQSVIDGPVLTGEFSTVNVGVLNPHPGPIAKCVDLSALGGRFMTHRYMALIGQDPGIVSNSAGVVFDLLSIVPLGPGAKPFRFDGTIGKALCIPVITAPGGSPYIAIQTLVTCSVGETMRFEVPLMTSALAGDSMFDLNASMSVPATEVLAVVGGQILGPGRMFEPGSIDSTDSRMVSLGPINGPSSLWIGDASFDDDAVPILYTHTTAGALSVVPFENAGAVTSLTENPITERFNLDRIALQDWNLGGTGRSDRLTGSVNWSITVKKNGGTTHQMTAWAQISTDGGSIWTTIGESRGSGPSDTKTQTVSGGAPIRFNRIDQFRLVFTSDTNGSADSIDAYRLTVSGRQ